MRSPRFTVRRMMLAVAIVGLLTGLYLTGQRTALYWRHAIFHELTANGLEQRLEGRPAADRARLIRAQLEYHRRMEAKYERAARYPWLALEPDPTEPKS